MKDVAFLFPGQGSQYIGMGKDFYESSPAAKRLFEEASDLVKKDFKTLCFQGPESTLIETDNVQPAITLVNLACALVLREEGVVPSAAAGHSLGEYAALHTAGVFSFADTMRLVHFRGTVMKEEAERHPGGMLAVFGLDLETLSVICEDVRETGSVEVANHNSPRQVILTGERAALERAAELAKKNGAQLLVPLKVSGPWHSRLMTGAKERLTERLNACSLGLPAFPVISNVTSDVHANQAEGIREALVEQMVRPVLWTASVSRLTRNGYRLFLEVGPGKVLTSLMRDITREAKALNVQDADSLSKLRAFRSASIAS